MDGSSQATNVTAGLPGFLVLFALGLVCWLLFRSMNKHLRKIRYDAGDLTSVKNKERQEQRPSGPGDGAP